MVMDTERQQASVLEGCSARFGTTYGGVDESCRGCPALPPKMPRVENVARLLAMREVCPSARRTKQKTWGTVSGVAESPTFQVQNTAIKQALGAWVEVDSLRNCTAKYSSLHPAPRSTIAAAFSTDGQYLASTHGDHTVKLIDCRSGQCVKILSGHRRTPWVVRFHPATSQILASGSLDHEVRLWNATTAQCIGFHDFYRPIASLAFHAQGDILGVASGHKLYIWQYTKDGEASQPAIVLRTRRSLRAIHFHPHGVPLLLTAEVNDLDSSECPPATATARAANTYLPTALSYTPTLQQSQPSTYTTPPRPVQPHQEEPATSQQALGPFPWSNWLWPSAERSRAAADVLGRGDEPSASAPVHRRRGSSQDEPSSDAVSMDMSPRQSEFVWPGPARVGADSAGYGPRSERTVLSRSGSGGGVLVSQGNGGDAFLGVESSNAEWMAVDAGGIGSPDRRDALSSYAGVGGSFLSSSQAAGTNNPALHRPQPPVQFGVVQTRTAGVAPPGPGTSDWLYNSYMPGQPLPSLMPLASHPPSWDLPLIPPWGAIQQQQQSARQLEEQQQRQGGIARGLDAAHRHMQGAAPPLQQVSVASVAMVAAMAAARAAAQAGAGMVGAAVGGPAGGALGASPGFLPSFPRGLADIGPAAEAAAQAAMAAAAAAELPCTVKLRVWHHDAKKPTAPLDPETCRLTIPHAVLCSEMGAHFSPCGRFLAACVACRPPAGEVDAFTQTLRALNGQPPDLSPGPLQQPSSPPQPLPNQSIVYELRLYSLEEDTFGEVLASRTVRAAHCLTSIQFSPTSQHILLAYGRRHNTLLRSLVADGSGIIPVYTILEVYRISDMSLVRVLPSAEDEVNVACFHPQVGGGLVYGTKEGKLRLVRHDRSLRQSNTRRNLEDELLEAETAEAYYSRVLGAESSA